MSLTYFPVTGRLVAIRSDTSADPDGTPDPFNISSFVYFTPSVNQVYDGEDLTVYRLETIRARTNTDLGEVVNIDETPVSLVANTDNLGIEELYYTVSFDHVEGVEEISSFRFLAPTDDTPVDLATVERVPK